MNGFDGLIATVFNTTTGLMGYDAVWYPMDNSPLQVARVHYKDKTVKDDIGDHDFAPETPVMEYKRGDFPGLKESLDTSNLERVTIDLRGTVVEFLAGSAKTTFDGGTIIVNLQVKK